MQTELGKHNDEVIAKARERCATCESLVCDRYNHEHSFDSAALLCFVDAGEAGLINQNN